METTVLLDQFEQARQAAIAATELLFESDPTDPWREVLQIEAASCTSVAEAYLLNYLGALGKYVSLEPVKLV